MVDELVEDARRRCRLAEKSDMRANNYPRVVIIGGLLR